MRTPHHRTILREAAAPAVHLAAAILVLAGPVAASAQENAAGQPSAGQEPPGEPDAVEEGDPRLDVTVDVTADLPAIDRLIAAEGQRVGIAEGAQLISADYIRAQQASTLADALRKTTSVQVDEEGGQQGSLVIIRGLSQDQVSVRVEGARRVEFNPADLERSLAGMAVLLALDESQQQAIRGVMRESDERMRSSIHGILTSEQRRKLAASEGDGRRSARDEDGRPRGWPEERRDAR